MTTPADDKVVTPQSIEANIDHDLGQAYLAAGQLALDSEGLTDPQRLAILARGLKDLIDTVTETYETVVKDYCAATTDGDYPLIPGPEGSQYRPIRREDSRTSFPNPDEFTVALVAAGVPLAVIDQFRVEKVTISNPKLEEAILAGQVTVDQVQPYMTVKKTKPFIQWEVIKP